MFKILKDNPIFHNISIDQLETFFQSSGEILEFNKDDVAYDSGKHIKSMMFLLNGSARVEQISEDNLTFLKRIEPGELFGVLSIFTDVDYYPTRVTFEKKSMVLMLKEHEVLELLNQDPNLLKNYLTFFNGQVQYLLDRIALFSIPSGEDRVLTYISRLKSSTQSNELTLPMSKVELAEYLGIARSTLYRVFDKLIENQMLEIKGNKLYILGGIK
ncbi:MAG: Crp/Fnr family transcriptional regulator [Clostridiales bacterium]|nr:Crp/Fnr family transcriptional regulator [Clostridiales bacterium]